MLTDYELSLCRRAVAAGWRWTRGCRSVCRYTVVAADELPTLWVQDDLFLTMAGSPQWTAAVWGRELPDFRDAATRGALLEQVRERWNRYDIGVYAVKMNGPAWFNVGVPWEEGGVFCGTGASETSALIAALEAAPEKNP
jgi:hypothetical protein